MSVRRVFYDFEFCEDGLVIDPLSLGMVDQAGREYYAVFEDGPWASVREDSWLREYVLPHLPLSGPVVKPGRVIAGEVRDFLVGPGEPLELWADFAAYDHVALAQLWGRMVDLPEGIPMFTHEVRQEIARLGVGGSLPEQVGVEHDALADARHCMALWEHCRDREAACGVG